MYESLLPKTARAAAVREFFYNRIHSTNRDVIPNEALELIVKPARTACGMKQRELKARAGGWNHKCNLSRGYAHQVAVLTQSAELMRLAHSEVYWDAVAAIEPCGEEEVFDLEVEGHHNFVANDIIVHNSIEQDADIVLLMHDNPKDYKQRDGTTVPGKSQANPMRHDIFVAKQRNGPTGTLRMLFVKNTLTFKSFGPEPDEGYRPPARAEKKEPEPEPVAVQVQATLDEDNDDWMNDPAF